MTCINGGNCRFLCNDDECKVCEGNSFKLHPRAKFWDYEKNNGITPRDVFKSSHKLYYFNCDKCNHSFTIDLAHIIHGNSWCQYCANQLLCYDDNCKTCEDKSFKNHPKAKLWNIEKNNRLLPRQIFNTSSLRFWFNCKCGHIFDSILSNMKEKDWCPFCRPNSIKFCKNKCDICDKKSFKSINKSNFWDYEKNEDMRPEYVSKYSLKKYWFICENKHSFEGALNNISQGKWCPICKNKTEHKLYDILIESYPALLAQFKTKWCKNEETDKYLPFDFCIEELKLIIELDGEQHFKQISNWQSPEDTQECDIYKMKKAIENGYSVIRLLQEDVYKDKNNWKENLLAAIKKYDEPTCIFLSNDVDKYINHQI